MPKTPMAKVLVFLYSVIGVPLCLIGLTKVGGKLCKNTFYISSRIFKYLKRKPTFITGRLVALLVAMNAGLFVWVIMPSLVYSYLEDWSYLNSLYHTIVTVTTIGFGDFVPNKRFRLHQSYLCQIVTKRSKNNKIPRFSSVSTSLLSGCGPTPLTNLKSSHAV